MSTRRHPGSGIAASIAILLVGLAVAVAWLLIGPGLLGRGSSPVLTGPIAQVQTVDPEAATPALLPGVKAVSSVQVSQPRDPFRPLITETAVVEPGGTPGGGGTSGQTVRLLAIEDVAGVLRATVEVGGVTYDVGVGETFAIDYQVVSLDGDSGVFLFRDNAFELSVGQSILK